MAWLSSIIPLSDIVYGTLSVMVPAPLGIFIDQYFDGLLLKLVWRYVYGIVVYRFTMYAGTLMVCGECIEECN
jgi:hypothetical protein